ncbi:SCO2524 family protein [Actinoplanes sp. NPDC051851]|uniref:SCO2524 family protein n=1 Tax=Actinoplanes sp. NPDC051851 TaxID=3154753 RepID=UPI0034370C0B
MRLQPRQELLSVWKSLSKWCGAGTEFTWDDRSGRNSISDAEMLLCLLLPPIRLDDIRFDRPDETRPDVCAALSAFGSAVEIPQRIIRLLAQYFETYTDAESKLPVFSVGTYVSTPIGEQRPATEEQKAVEVVDAFAVSVVLATAVIRFARSYRNQVQRASNRAEVDNVERLARDRLTAAMAGLQRSFTVNIFRADSSEGRVLCEKASPDGYSPAVVNRIREGLSDVMAGLRELSPNDATVADLLENRDLLFECGWSWGIVRDSEPVKTGSTVYSQVGHAESAPYLYFTVVAVDGIRELFDPATRRVGLLDDEQQLLARTLNLQWDLAQRYWSTVATLGEERWPIEDLPWRTTDEEESDYYSLLVLSLVRHALADRGAPDSDLERLTRILEDLADRGRIRRRPLADDPALLLHHPGTWIQFNGAESLGGPESPRVGWRMGELGTLLLGRSLSVAQRVNDHRLRARLLDLTDRIWGHLEQRRLRNGKGAGLWDNPANVYPTLPERTEPSWYHTNRVVQCMATAAELVQGTPPSGVVLADVAAELLIEAEDVFDEEQLRGSGSGGPALRESLTRQSIGLRRARRLMATRPGTSAALTLEVLRELDKLAAAREFEVGE